MLERVDWNTRDGQGLIAPNLILCVKAIGGPLEFNIEVTPIEDAY